MDEESIRASLYDLPRLLTLRAAVRRVSRSQDPRLEAIFGPRDSRGRRVALLPGSFNPLTLAHTSLADAALHSGDLDVVFFLLSTRTIEKEVVVGAAPEDRLLVLQLYGQRSHNLGGLLANRGLYVEQAELARASLHLDRVVFLVGYDKVVQVLDARYYADRDEALDRLCELASFLVAPRGPHDTAELTALLARPENRRYADAIRPIDLPGPVRDIASSRVREAAPEVRSRQIPLEAEVFAAETGAYDIRDGSGGRVDRYRVRLALLDALEVTGSSSGGGDFRSLFHQALARGL